MKIAVLGGDGFVGWPTALHLSDAGHEVHILDNLSRRWIDTELGVQSLTPMDSIQDRMAAPDSMPNRKQVTGGDANAERRKADKTGWGALGFRACSVESGDRPTACGRGTAA